MHIMSSKKKKRSQSSEYYQLNQLVISIQFLTSQMSISYGDKKVLWNPSLVSIFLFTIL